MHGVERRLVAAPRVSHRADFRAVDVLHLRQRCLHGRRHAVEPGPSGVPLLEHHVGAEDEVTLLAEDLWAIHRTVAESDVLMKALREFFVVVHEHRVLLARLVVGRIREHHLQLVAVRAAVARQHLLAPRVVVLERVGARHRLRRAEGVGRGHEVVGRVRVALLEVDVALDVARLSQCRNRLVAPDESFDLSGHQAGVAALLAPVAGRREEHRLGQVDGDCAAAAEAPESAAARTVRVERHVAVDGRVFATAREPLGGRPVDLQAPEVEPVVHERGILRRCPSGQPVHRAFRCRVIVLEVHEAGPGFLGEVHALAGGGVVAPPLTLLRIQHVPAAGADRRRTDGPAGNRVALSGARIDANDVAIRSPRHHFLRVRGLVAGECGRAVIGELQGLVVIGLQLRDAAGRELPRDGQRALPVLRGVDFLLVKLAQVLPVPHLHAGGCRRFWRTGRGPCGFRFARCDAEDQRAAIGGPLQGAVRRDAQAGGELRI